MRIGVPKEIKNAERRVGLTPASVRELVAHGHDVLIESSAGIGIGATDAAYAATGARIVDSPEQVFDGADLIVKVKEPQPSERAMLRADHVLFTYLHLAPDPDQAYDLISSGATCVAYETVTDAAGRLPLLAPMSQVAGRMAAEIGAHLLKHPGPGRGKLLGGVAGVPPGKVVIVGSGTVATAAARVLMGLDARVIVMSQDFPRLAYLQESFGGRIATRVSSPQALAEELRGADLAILSVLVPGAAAPKVVTRQMVRSMGTGAVIVDVSIDQGGASETSRPTSHSEPTYVDEGVVHYCVTNMPGAVPATSTQALTSATFPYVEAIAEHGIEDAMRRDRSLAEALSTHKGQLVRGPVAEEFGIPAAANPFL